MKPLEDDTHMKEGPFGYLYCDECWLHSVPGGDEWHWEGCKHAKEKDNEPQARPE